MDLFKYRRLVIATKHSKEQVIAPPMENSFGVQCIVPGNFDTDLLGTFSGEVERELDPLSTARKKCELAMELTGCDIAIASEGSFGPHPYIPFLPADEELLLLIDKQNSLEIFWREISTAANFAAEIINSEEELMAFAEKVLFPSHGIILRKAQNDWSSIVKGITNHELLRKKFYQIFTEHKSVFAETDMRAMYNPTRMQVIEKATQQLVTKINSLCPVCNTPGFWATDARAGLPCQLCGLPTKSTLSHICSCEKCMHSEVKLFPNGKTEEDPRFCDYCNP